MEHTPQPRIELPQRLLHMVTGEVIDDGVRLSDAGNTRVIVECHLTRPVKRERLRRT